MRFIVIFFSALALSAQDPSRPFPIPNPVFEYLKLEPGQQRSIARNNGQFFEWRNEKERRIWQVQSEIAEETAREPLNPPALGIRYAEVESLCREIDERTKQLLRVNQALLTAEQRLRLSALSEALKLVPIANQAIGSHLIEGPPIGSSNVIPAAQVVPVILPPPQGSGRTGACVPPTGGFARFLLGIP